MALLNAGYWQTTYWPEDYWDPDYWQTYGVPAGPSFTSYGIPFLYTSANWGAVNFYFEAYYKATTGTVYARLYNITDSAAVANSQVSTAQTSYQRDRSVALTLTDGKTYRAQFGKAGADAGKFLGAKLVITD